MRIALILAVCLLLFSGCGVGEGKGDSVEEQEQFDKIEIGMSFDSFVIERWRRERDIFVSVAQELGAEVNVQSASGDLEEQKKQINYFIDKGVDVIVIICIDSEGLSEQVARAKSKGIKVIAYDRLIHNAELDLYISFDNEMVGRLMGEALVENGIENGKVLMLCGPTTDDNVALVENGFKRVMVGHQVTVLDTVHVDNWRAELAAEYVYENMEIVEQADAIMCGNDNVASQVVYALAESRRAGIMPVVGQDADLEACQRIVEGTQVMTVYKQVEKLASRAAEYAVQLAKGEQLVGKDVGVILNGEYAIPYVYLNPIAVTKENMEEEIIKSGFHLREEVYLNVSETDK